jgi:hypothetical protein
MLVGANGGDNASQIGIGVGSLRGRAVMRAVRFRLLTAAIMVEPATLLPASEAHMMMRPKRPREDLEALFLRVIEALVEGLLGVGEFLQARCQCAGVDARPDRMVAAHWRAAMRSARALAISQIAVPADNVGGRTSPCDDYILVVGAVENHNLALSRRMIVGAPKEVVGELFKCGLFEAGYIDRLLLW